MKNETVTIETIGESLYCLEISFSGARYVFSVYLIDDGGGVLIEPGPASIIPSIKEGMQQLGMKGLSTIIPTHIHLDHGGGSGELAALFPQAKLVVHPRGLKHLLDPSRLIEGTKKAYGDDFELKYGAIRSVPQSQLMVAEDGEILSLPGRELLMVHAPGHAHHQIAIFDKKTGGLFCGEALGIPLRGKEGFVLPAVSVPDFNPDLYLETIEKLKQLTPRVLYYSHDGGVQDPEILVSNLEQNVRLLRDITFQKLKNKETVDSIAKGIGEMIFGTHRNRELMSPLRETILGFSTYYQRKGLL
jgi:glyoxylase-like metal-dependent hydrolase (beta-lactamase superfamily II)